MSITSLIYLAGLVNPLQGFLGFISFVLVSLGCILIGCAASNDTLPEGEIKRIVLKLGKYFIIPAFIMSIICVFIPSEKTIYLMVGTNYLKDSTLPLQIQKAIQLKLDDIIKNLEPKKDE
jgi:hypothetical protein